MRRAPWLRAAIRAGNELAHPRKSRARHNAINLTCLAGLVLAIVGVLALSTHVSAALYLALAPVVLGPLLFGVFVLVIHESSHAMFVLHRDRGTTRRWNHAIGDLTALLLFTEYRRHWAKAHPQHHQRPCEADDVQYNHNYEGRELVGKLVLLALVPGYALTLNPSRRYGAGPRVLVAIGLWLGFAAAASVWLAWTAPFALLFGFNHLQIWNLQRKSQEHGAGLADEPDPLLRSCTWWSPVGWLGAPFNINYHFEHHLNMVVPWYSLPEYHRRLLAIVPEPIQPLVFSGDYIGQLCHRRPQYTPELMRLVTGEDELDELAEVVA